MNNNDNFDGLQFYRDCIKKDAIAKEIQKKRESRELKKIKKPDNLSANILDTFSDILLIFASFFPPLYFLIVWKSPCYTTEQRIIRTFMYFSVILFAIYMTFCFGK